MGQSRAWNAITVPGFWRRHSNGGSTSRWTVHVRARDGRVAGRKAEASGEVSGASSYVPGLDGLRAIAISAVFLLHLDRARFPGGGFGVDVFFVLSAYLITSLLLAEAAGSGGVRFAHFYWRRFFRLAPALVVWLFVLAIPTTIITHQTATTAWGTAGSLFYFSDFLEAWTHHIGPAFDQSWSLSVEEQFYVLWPAILVLVVVGLKGGPRRIAMAGFVLTGAVVSLAFGNYFLPTGHLLPIALGCWAAEQIHYGLDGRIRRFLQLPFLDVVCCAIFTIALLVTYAPVTARIIFVAVVVATAVLIMRLCTGATGPVSEALGSRVPRWLGARSYAAYLYGLTLMVLVPAVTHLPLHYAAPVDIVLTLVIIAASYRYLEAPLRVKGRAWLASSGGSRHEPVPTSQVAVPVTSRSSAD